MKNKEVIKYIVNWLKDYSDQSRTNGFVIGISGGIDSALTSTLVAMTGKPVLCLEMPIHQAANQVSRARKHINWLKDNFTDVTSREVELTNTFESLKTELRGGDSDDDALPLANTRARLRMTTLYYYAGLKGALVAGTGNKVEDFGVGFFTKYGDGGVDLSPIADLMKSEVYALAKELNVTEEILSAKPTDGLFGDNRSDEDQLGASYDELEWAMRFLLTNETEEQLDARQREVLKIYNRLNGANQHKMNPIPVCIIPDDLK